MENFSGKAIYKPSGKAGEYAEWACNFYVGCSNGCDYCYCKKGRSAKWLGGDTPTLKKCFRDETHALEVFEKDLTANLLELQKHGLFFSFTTDPMLDLTMDLTLFAVEICVTNSVPVKLLTKVAHTTEYMFFGQMIGGNGELHKVAEMLHKHKDKIALGFTLTGHDEMELGASTNAERIEAMRKLHNAGFRTFASIEPIIDFESSMRVIEESAPYCDHFKIGLMSGKKYDRAELWNFIEWAQSSGAVSPETTIYFKDSLLRQAGYERIELLPNCVNSNYNIFAN